MNRKKLSADGLIEILNNTFSKIDDHRGNNVKYSIKDSLMTSFAAFSLKYDSFNSFFDDLDNSKIKKQSVQNLFKVKDVPSSTRLKEIIDPISSELLSSGFNDIFRELQRGKVLDQFKFLDKYYLLAIDGTQTFQSYNIHCKKCLVKKPKNDKGEISYSHQMLAACIVHPSIKQVIPVAPEPIINEDGNNKNDCERNAAKRFLKKFKKAHPKLSTVIIEDGLASNGPHIRDLKSYNMHFILGAKPGDHKYLFDWIDRLDNVKKIVKSHLKGKKVIRRITEEIRYVNNVPLNNTNNDLLVNFLEITEIIEKKIEIITHDANGVPTISYVWEPEGKATKFSWVTDLKLSDDNVFDIMLAGRKRWAIENETFNTLKNLGYNLERNFGHGNENLATNFSLLMMLAFFVDQVQELCCKTFQAVLIKMKRKKRLWSKLRSIFIIYLIKTNWAGLFNSILAPPTEILTLE